MGSSGECRSPMPALSAQVRVHLEDTVASFYGFLSLLWSWVTSLLASAVGIPWNTMAMGWNHARPGLVRLLQISHNLPDKLCTSKRCASEYLLPF